MIRVAEWRRNMYRTCEECKLKSICGIKNVATDLRKQIEESLTGDAAGALTIQCEFFKSDVVDQQYS